MKDEFNFSTGLPSAEMAQYLQMFVDETSEQLDLLQDVLLKLESNPTSHEDLNEAFRLIHSIKGASAMMGLDSISVLTHHLETHFDRLRSGLQVLDQDLMDLILRCIDFLRDSTDKLRSGQALVSAPGLLEEVSQLSATGSPGSTVSEHLAPKLTSQPTFPPEPEPVPVAEPEAEPETELSRAGKPPSVIAETPAASSEPEHKRVIVYFERGVELPELRAELVIARIAELAEILRQSPPQSDLARIAELGTLQLWIRTHRTDDELRTAANVVGVEVLEIEAFDPDSLQESSEKSSSTAPSNTETTSPIIPVAMATRPVNPSTAVVTQEASPTLVDRHEPSATADSAAQPTIEEKSTATAESKSGKVIETVRVDIQRLDRLMNLTGELVVNRARFVQLAAQMSQTFKKSGLQSDLHDLCDGLRQALRATAILSGSGSENPKVTAEGIRALQGQVEAIENQLQILNQGRRSFALLNETIDQLNRVATSLQRGVREARMLPISPLFNRFKRTVRDISMELKKKVQLELRGENTELDKRMIDELGDPLVHLVRNAIDHGLESEQERRLRGKPEIGTLTLEAAHSGNSVLIYVRDDGGGINTDRVRQRAIDRGLVSRSVASEMTDRDLAQFIWQPGFSTADSVSSLSGRGVGMDIVKTRVAELSGTIDVESTPGEGTTFIIRLPLTLAIIHGLLFRAKHGIFAAPVENVREIVSVKRSEIYSIQGQRSIEVRGKFIPLVNIDEIFDWHTTPYEYPRIANERRIPESNRVDVVILSSTNRVMGLTAWELCGGQDIVIKSLAENFVHVRGLAGASILGDGSVCLLLDVSATIEMALGRLKQRRPTTTVNA